MTTEPESYGDASQRDTDSHEKPASVREVAEQCDGLTVTEKTLSEEEIADRCESCEQCDRECFVDSVMIASRSTDLITICAALIPSFNFGGTVQEKEVARLVETANRILTEIEKHDIDG